MLTVSLAGKWAACPSWAVGPVLATASLRRISSTSVILRRKRIVRIKLSFVLGEETWGRNQAPLPPTHLRSCHPLLRKGFSLAHSSFFSLGIARVMTSACSVVKTVPQTRTSSTWPSSARGRVGCQHGKNGPIDTPRTLRKA